MVGVPVASIGYSGICWGHMLTWVWAAGPDHKALPLTRLRSAGSLPMTNVGLVRWWPSSLIGGPFQIKTLYASYLAARHLGYVCSLVPSAPALTWHAHVHRCVIAPQPSFARAIVSSISSRACVLSITAAMPYPALCNLPALYPRAALHKCRTTPPSSTSSTPSGCWYHQIPRSCVAPVAALNPHAPSPPPHAPLERVCRRQPTHPPGRRNT